LSFSQSGFNVLAASDAGVAWNSATACCATSCVAAAWRCRFHTSSPEDEGGSDDEQRRAINTQLVQAAHPSQQEQQQQQQQQQHHHHHSQHHPHRSPGHLHASHGRRHATNTSTGNSNRGGGSGNGSGGLSAAAARDSSSLSTLLLGCRSLGVLRRLMLKHKANIGPSEAADTLLALQHLVLVARRSSNAAARRAGSARAASPPPPPPLPPLSATTAAAAAVPGAEFVWVPAVAPAMAAPPHMQQSASSGEQQAGEQQSSPSWRPPVGHVAAAAARRTAETDGPSEQLVAQMLGELGNAVWHQMGDMRGPELAKALFSWAAIGWHPEQQLLADVVASFLAAASGAGDSHGRSSSSSAGATDLSRQQQQQQQQQREAAGGLVPAPQDAPWLAAGLWAMCKLEEPLVGPALDLLCAAWPALLPQWSPQQLVDVAWAIAHTSDGETAASLSSGNESVALALEARLQPVVLGLAARLADVQRRLVVSAAEQQQQQQHDVQQQQQQQQQATQQQRPVCLPAGVHRMADVWPAVLLAAAPQPRSTAVVPPALPVALCPPLPWRMLQALAAVGLNVSEPGTQGVGELVAALSAAMQTPPTAQLSPLNS
jgi:hypothetical protein